MLKLPKSWFPVLAIVVPCLWAMCWWYRDWPLAVITALMSIYLALDIRNLVRKKRAARKQSKP